MKSTRPLTRTPTKGATIRASGSFAPFGGLARLLPHRPGPSVGLVEKPTGPTAVEKTALDHWTLDGSALVADPDRDQRLFSEAMADVIPLTPANQTEYQVAPVLAEAGDQDQEADCLLQLKALIDWGKGFVVEQTPEYIQGTGPGAHPCLARRLHRGQFAIQAHVDLHGLSICQARQRLEAFFKQALADGKRAVLVVHGRGLCSSGEPVLKVRFYQWLTSGPWRKQVLAFASARSFDGGTGATYVLFRRKPLTKQMVKRAKGRKPS